MKRKILSLLLLMSLVFPVFGCKETSKAAMLSSTTKAIQKGSKLKIDFYFYYGKTKPKWSVSNKKLKITKRNKTSCTIKGVKTGTAYVRCKVGIKTYKRKITVKPKSKVTFGNYKRIETGMTLEDVTDIIGDYSDISDSRNHTEEEYAEYYQWAQEDSFWNDEVWREQTTYMWSNPWTLHTIYVTFNDGVSAGKRYY